VAGDRRTRRGAPRVTFYQAKSHLDPGAAEIATNFNDFSARLASNGRLKISNAFEKQE
jgi:hypothetical protein